MNKYLTCAASGLALIIGSLTAPVAAAAEVSDPLQPVNRPLERFNDELDKRLLKPVADGYMTIVPKPVRQSVSNFFSNVGYLNVVLNDFLQGKFKQGFSDTGRFAVNTTVGVGGLFDPASSFGMPQHEEDFGQTLGVWGNGPGSYLVLPIGGPSSTRDVSGTAVSAVTNILFYVSSLAISAPLTLLSGIDRRANADIAINFRNEAALDPYVFTREAYTQHRTFLVYDGNPPVDNSLFEDSTAQTEAGGEASAAEMEKSVPVASAHQTYPVVHKSGPRPVN